MRGQVNHGIRSSYELAFSRVCRELTFAAVTEIAKPDYVVVDAITGTLRAVYLRVRP